MDPKDDPEARIRELERSLGERASELGTGHDIGSGSPPPTQPWTYGNYPPPPPGPPAPWPGYVDQFPPPLPPPPPPKTGSGARLLIVLGAVLAFLVAGGVSAYLMFTGGEQATSQTPSRSRVTATVTAPAIPPSPSPAQPPSVTTPAPGETVVVSGINERRTVECNGNAVIVSGIENTLTITGHCSNIGVSGIQNTITADSADSIAVSGFENHVTYHSGTPEITNSGSANVVQQG